jgi:hypothetical protein
MREEPDRCEGGAHVNVSRSVTRYALRIRGSR